MHAPRPYQGFGGKALLSGVVAGKSRGGVWMDSTTIRIIAGVLFVVIVFIIVARRKKMSSRRKPL